MIVNRFMWEDIEKGVFRQSKRIRCAVKFEEVINVKSRNINQKNESLILSWKANSVEKNIIADEKKFNFYIRSEFDQKSNTKQIDDNEINAQDLILKIIKLSLN